MPSRKDAFARAKELLQLAGVQTVVRGQFVPEEAGDSVPVSAYPVAGYVERGTEQTNPQEYSYHLVFEIEIDVFVWTDWIVNPGIGDMGFDKVDDLHDAILRQFSYYFAGDSASGGNTPQTFVFRITKYEPWWFYKEKQGVAAATFTLECQMNFA